MVPIGRDSFYSGDRSEELKLQVARELHDQVAQSLNAMLVQMERFKRQNAQRQPVVQGVESFQDSTREVLANVRQLLEDLRGEPGLKENFVRAIREGLLAGFARKSGIAVRVRVARSWPRKLPHTSALNIYRIMQEALNNVWMHSGADTVWVTLRMDEKGWYEVTIGDNGRGLVVMHSADHSAMGILGMSERTQLLGGQLRMESRAGRGTVVRAVFPALQPAGSAR